MLPDAVVIDPREQDLQRVVEAETDEGVGVDVAIECVGLEASLNACARAVRRGGKIVQVGLHMKPAAIDAMLWAQKDITFEGFWCFRVQMWPRIISMIEIGVFPVDKVVTAEIAAEDVVAGGFERLLDPSGQDLKVLVRVSYQYNCERAGGYFHAQAGVAPHVEDSRCGMKLAGQVSKISPC
jgi:(R,R)-butanediol dehydrogenase / meso-butanediol dehydrogenase / diacetyl reductase